MSDYYMIAKIRNRIYISIFILVLLVFLSSTISIEKFEAVESLHNSITIGESTSIQLSEWVKLIFRITIFPIVLIMLFKNIFRTSKALKNPDKLDELKIKEYDERSRFINYNVGYLGFEISTIGISIAAFLVAEIDFSAFVTLLSVLLFLLIVRYCLRRYYSSKY